MITYLTCTTTWYNM